jgi:acetoacetate decarboxylase
MSYPAPPWHLQGIAYLSLHPIAIGQARTLIPPDLQIIPIFPGYTLAGVYISSYRTGSVLEYNELIIAPAIVRYRNHIGGWISHIYVDNEDSVRGGRGIWGLPKEMAGFHWRDGEINISQQEHPLCNFSVRSNPLSIASWGRPSLTGDCFSQLHNEIAKFKSKFKAKIHIVSTNLQIPLESPFSRLKIGHSLLSTRLDDLELAVEPPCILA